MTEAVEVLIVGSGFSGIGAAKRLLDAGVTSVRLLERGDDVGAASPGVGLDAECIFMHSCIFSSENFV